MKLVRTRSDVGLCVLASMGREPTMKVGLEISEPARKRFFETGSILGIVGAGLGLVALLSVKQEARDRLYEYDILSGRVSNLNDTLFDTIEENKLAIGYGRVVEGDDVRGGKEEVET